MGHYLFTIYQILISLINCQLPLARLRHKPKMINDKWQIIGK